MNAENVFPSLHMSVENTLSVPEIYAFNGLGQFVISNYFDI